MPLGVALVVAVGQEQQAGAVLVAASPRRAPRAAAARCPRRTSRRSRRSWRGTRSACGRPRHRSGSASASRSVEERLQVGRRRPRVLVRARAGSPAAARSPSANDSKAVSKPAVWSRFMSTRRAARGPSRRPGRAGPPGPGRDPRTSLRGTCRTRRRRTFSFSSPSSRPQDVHVPGRLDRGHMPQQDRRRSASRSPPRTSCTRRPVRPISRSSSGVGPSACTRPSRGRSRHSTGSLRATPRGSTATMS